MSTTSDTHCSDGKMDNTLLKVRYLSRRDEQGHRKTTQATAELESILQISNPTCDLSTALHIHRRTVFHNDRTGHTDARIQEGRITSTTIDLGHTFKLIAVDAIHRLLNHTPASSEMEHWGERWSFDDLRRMNLQDRVER